MQRMAGWVLAPPPTLRPQYRHMKHNNLVPAVYTRLTILNPLVRYLRFPSSLFGRVSHWPCASSGISVVCHIMIGNSIFGFLPCAWIWQMLLSGDQSLAGETVLPTAWVPEFQTRLLLRMIFEYHGTC